MDKVQRHTQREESGTGLWTQDASKEGQPVGQGLGLEQIPFRANISNTQVRCTDIRLDSRKGYS